MCGRRAARNIGFNNCGLDRVIGDRCDFSILLTARKSEFNIAYCLSQLSAGIATIQQQEFRLLKF
jgi:hypothetical protein